MNKLFIIVIGLLAIGALFLCVDCSAGRTRYLEAVVSEKYYRPAWTEYHTDSKGHHHTTHHLEQFHVVCSVMGSEQTFDIESRRAYNSKTNGEPITIFTRQGKWTSFSYGATIE